MKKLISLTLALIMVLSFAVFADASDDVVVINVGYENAVTEPAAKACEKWKELVDERSNGTIDLELFPNSALGKKNDLIDQMLMGENIITVADGAFLAEYGVPDFGFFYAPYAFESWDDLWTVLDSDWYADLCDQLAGAGGLRVLSSNWIYGARDILSIKPIHTPEDLAGLKMRVSSNDLSTTSFNDLGAASIGMDMGDVYQAMSGGTIDAVENPISSLYNRSFQEVAKYLILDGHVKNFTTWVCSADWYNSLTPEQQTALTETCKEAGEYNNELVLEADSDYLQKMKDAGVEVVEPSEEVLEGFKEKAQAFYEMGDTFGWSDGLYDTVMAAMGK